MSTQILSADPAPAYLAERSGRLYEAALRGLRRLPGEAQAQLAGLFDPYTLLTLVVVVGLWVGSHFIGIGWLADVGLLLYGGYGLAKDLVVAVGDFTSWYNLASDAKTEQDLDRAGEHFGRALTTVGIDTILTLLSASAFKALRAKIHGDPKKFGKPPPEAARPVEPIEGKPAEGKPAEGKPAEGKPAGKPQEGPGERPSEPAPPPRPRPPSPLVGGLVATGALRTSSSDNAIWWLIGGAAVTLIGVGTAVALASGGRGR